MSESSFCRHGVPIFERCLECEGQQAEPPEPLARMKNGETSIVSMIDLSR